MITIEVNNKSIEAKQGETILDALNREGLNVPTLCHIKDMLPTGACRMCVVEEEKTGRLLPSCSYPAEDGMRIKTHSQRVIEARKMILELLLSNHPDDCLYCVRNGNCELQTQAKQLDVRERRLSGKKNDHHLDRSGASIERDPAKCILCGRCVRVCEEVMGVSAIDFINRGSQTVIGTTFNKGINTSSCVNCGQCIVVCPTAALREKNHFAAIQQALNDPQKTVVVQYAPAISISIAEKFGMEVGRDINDKLNSALRKIGFDYVFDTTFAADLTIMEEATELVARIQNNATLPLITSCCPAWVKYAEEFALDFLDNVSTCKSPQQMLGSIINSYFAQKVGIKPENIYSVAVMPCTAKKFEAQREEMTHQGITDVDAVLSTRELARLIKLHGIDMHHIEAELTDSPLGVRSSAGKLFATSGGVMEAALRTGYYLITGKEMKVFTVKDVKSLNGIKITKIKIEKMEIGVAVVSGLANARKLLDQIRNGRNDIQFIEIMACPGGCIAGGGQPYKISTSILRARMQSLYNIDASETLKTSHKNPEIQELYRAFLGEPGSHKAHELLHTHYSPREVLV